MTLARPANIFSLLVWTAAATLLVLPAVAMRFTAEVNWTALDFVAWAMMLAAAAAGFELLSRRAPNWFYRAGAAIAIGTLFLLVWVNLAVGIVGSERNDTNLMYAGVIAIAVGGACHMRFRAPGMAATMLATAAAQLTVGAIAVALRLGSDGPIWPRDVLGATALFKALWLTAAALFRRS